MEIYSKELKNRKNNGGVEELERKQEEGGYDVVTGVDEGQQKGRKKGKVNDQIM